MNDSIRAKRAKILAEFAPAEEDAHLVEKGERERPHHTLRRRGGPSL
ncbi:UNVERIFIED_ORG: hypothetical protein GGE44_000962 [Rhizobium esperanzae]